MGSKHDAVDRLEAIVDNFDSLEPDEVKEQLNDVIDLLNGFIPVVAREG